MSVELGTIPLLVDDTTACQVPTTSCRAQADLERATYRLIPCRSPRIKSSPYSTPLTPATTPTRPVTTTKRGRRTIEYDELSAGEATPSPTKRRGSNGKREKSACLPSPTNTPYKSKRTVDAGVFDVKVAWATLVKRESDILTPHLLRSHNWVDHILPRKVPLPKSDPITPSVSSAPNVAEKLDGIDHLRSEISCDNPSLVICFVPSNAGGDIKEWRRRLLAIKPTLIQEKVADDPFRLLLAVILLNKTSWKQATPVFWRILDRWLDAASLSHVPEVELVEVLRPLGLQNTRACRILTFSKQYGSAPPSTQLYPLRVDKTYPLTAVANYAGVGRYAADSWRIYSPTLEGGGAPRGAKETLEGFFEPENSEQEWKKVRPLDKELRWYLIWRWAVEGYKWTPEYGRGERIDEAYISRLLPDYQMRMRILIQRRNTPTNGRLIELSERN
ncbi:DNA glycosylase [Dacryopinax primogenitus]|uniref:DNA glycosylase n=1 Tax=Dacryopinax primogenitus (strain DJM 731) TaxID=1858805 RepID=M5G523_DACPD|nr:DNA glycosylase [Dacryopinax primogenitus]EJT98852.1 DNA glycosylase [Dacryopinax primogenitus]